MARKDLRPLNKRIAYNASFTGSKFHKSKKFQRGMIGPIGSGKSVACVMELLKKGIEQEPFEGVRKTRFVVIRNTYRELIDTTIKTFFDWIPEQSGEMSHQNMEFHFVMNLPDKTIVEMDVLFRALDRPNDVKKLLSLELTGGWINEAKEIPRAVLDMLCGRVGRYPSKRDGGPSWWGVILDTNPPDVDHWWYKMFEDNCPENAEIFHQPSGLSTDAENVENLPPNYYSNMIHGKDQEWVNVFVHGNYGFVADGKPVMPEYNDTYHFDDNLKYRPGADLLIGIDFGLTPAATIIQKSPLGQYQFIDEVVTEDMGAVRFSKRLNKLLRKKYPKSKIEGYGDPAGEQRAQTDEKTPFDILWANDLDAIEPAPTNDFTIRREAMARCLTTLIPDVGPMMIIGPNCKMLRKGLNGGYKMKRINVPGLDKFHDKPDKSIYSHVCEAGHYALVGDGVGDLVIEPKDQSHNHLKVVGGMTQ